MLPSNNTRSVLTASASASLMLAGTTGLLAQAAAPAPPPANPPWETSAAIGITYTTGNTKTLNAIGSILTTRKDKVHEWAFGIDGSYGENDGVKNSESLHGFGQYNHLFTEKFYVFGRADYLHDDVASIKYRVTVSAGPGYYFIKNSTTTLNGEFGPGVVFERLRTANGGRDNNSYVTLRFAERLEHKFNEKTKLWQSVEFLPQIDDWNNYVVNFELGIDTLLTKKLSLRPYIQDTYDNVPAEGRKKNDFKFVCAIAYKF